MRNIIYRSKDFLLSISNWLILPTIIIVLFAIISQVVGYNFLVNKWEATPQLKVVLIISSIFNSVIAIIVFLIAFLMLFYIFSILWPTSLWLLALSGFFILISIILGVYLVFSINYANNIVAGYVWLQSNYNQWWFVFVFILTIILQTGILVFLGKKMMLWVQTMRIK